MTSLVPPPNAQRDAAGQRFRRVAPIAFTLLCGILLSAAAFMLVRRQERERVERNFDWLARSHTDALQATIRDYEQCLFSLRNLFDSSEHVDPREFKRSAADLRARHHGIHLLQWLPHVRHADRAAFESLAQKEVDPKFQINQGEHVDHDAAKDFLPVEERANYLPIGYIEPIAGNELAYGFDHFRGPHRATIEQAMESGMISASRRVQLREPTGKEFGWVLFLPVFAKDAETRRSEAPGQKLRGFVEGAFRLSDLVTHNRPDQPADVLDLLLVDRTPGSPEPYLISLADGRVSTAAPPDVPAFQSGLHHESTLALADREWFALYRPTAAWLASQTTIYPVSFLIGGLWLTGLLTALLSSAQRRTRTVERHVRERTAELRATQRELHDDIEQRQAVEERYRAFVEQSTEAIWRFELAQPLRIDQPEDAQLEHFYTHSFLAECNDTVAHMYGHRRAADLVGKRLAELMPRSDPVNLAHLRQYVRSGFRIADSESHEIGADGKKRIFLNNITGIIEHGCLTRYWGTQRDVTEQRRAEQERRRAEAHLRTALAAANLGTWEWDLETDLVTWSEATERIFGFDPGEFDGQLSTYLSMVHPEDREKSEARLRQATREGGSLTGDLRILRRDGEVRWIFSRGDVTRNNHGRIVRVVGAVLDITERHAAVVEKARIDQRLQETQKLESLGILAGGIAHDFNNLLTGILGNASLARMDLPRDSPVQGCLEAIETTSQRAAELCKQMLAYSGKGHFVVQRLDLSALVEDTAHLVQLSINKSAALKFSLARDLPAISADATQMRQIIMNLVINASDALGEAGGVINLTTGLIHADHAYLTETYLSPDLPDGDYVFLEVSDNGCGMTPETLKKIFDPFFTTKFTGRGLGLAAVLGIVRGHHGALKVYSEEGKGTTFKLLLPRAEGAPEDLSKKAPASTVWRGSGTVLVVDDETPVRIVAGRMLESIGFDVVFAAHGREAVEKFRETPDKFAAVLLDLTMPQMDGSATFTELRRLRPEVKVLLMSGFNEQDAIHRFAGKGLAGFLQKPFKPAALHEKLRGMFE